MFKATRKPMFTRGQFMTSDETHRFIPVWIDVDGCEAHFEFIPQGGGHRLNLLLFRHLGIDFECKGDRVYRLPDGAITFLDDDLPKDGETLRYDIKINSYARSGESLLFFFSYDCYMGEKKIIKMEGGCAGFFTDAEVVLP